MYSHIYNLYKHTDNTYYGKYDTYDNMINYIKNNNIDIKDTIVYIYSLIDTNKIRYITYYSDYDIYHINYRLYDIDISSY